MSEKRFPVLGRATWALPETCPESIPWQVIKPHETQAIRNHGGQSLARLAERGGLDPSEMVAVLEDREYRIMPLGEAVEKLVSIVWPKGESE